jgi:hypothetical protein
MHQDGFNSSQIMISKIISRAACLKELTSNSKSFSNCPDLHGGVPGLPGDRICMKPALGKKRLSRWQLQCLWPKIRLSKWIANFKPNRLQILTVKRQ